MLENNPNTYLLTLAALGWVVSLYFGFFRYRQYIWSRNKVRYDLMHKIDQQRGDIAAKLLMFCEINTTDELPQAKRRFLLRRYLSLLQQVNFYEHEGVFDKAILGHFRDAAIKDLEQVFDHDKELEQLVNNWLTTEAEPGNFLSTLNFEHIYK